MGVSMGRSRLWAEGGLVGTWVVWVDTTSPMPVPWSEVPKGHLSGDVRVCIRGSFLVSLGTPAVASSLPRSASGSPTPCPQGLPGVMAALELLRRTIFQKSPRCQAQAPRVPAY